jgi:hypothetical protein
MFNATLLDECTSSSALELSAKHCVLSPFWGTRCNYTSCPFCPWMWLALVNEMREGMNDLPTWRIQLPGKGTKKGALLIDRVPPKYSFITLLQRTCHLRLSELCRDLISMSLPDYQHFFNSLYHCDLRREERHMSALNSLSWTKVSLCTLESL